MDMVNNMVMSKANVFEVKARLSEYLDRAARGERIVICRHNRPVAELRAVEDIRTEPRPIGPLPGQPTFEVPASFFEPMSEEELNLWEGGDSPAPSVPTRPSKTKRAPKAAESRSRYGSRRRS